MRVVDFAVSVLLSIFVRVRRVLLVFQVCFVCFHIGGDVMRLQVVLVLHDEHVVVGDQVVRLVRNRVVQLIVEVIVARIVLLRRLQNVLNLRLELLLFFYLLLLFYFVHRLLILYKLLPLVFLPYRLVDHAALLL